MSVINPRNRIFKILAIGAELGGVRVIKHVTPDATHAAECIYRVQFLCCGEEKNLTHTRVVMRHSQGRLACRSCSRRMLSPWSNADVTRALEMRARGMSCGKIGLALGVPAGTVTGWCETRA